MCTMDEAGAAGAAGAGGAGGPPSLGDVVDVEKLRTPLEGSMPVSDLPRGRIVHICDLGQLERAERSYAKADAEGDSALRLAFNRGMLLHDAANWSAVAEHSRPSSLSTASETRPLVAGYHAGEATPFAAEFVLDNSAQESLKRVRSPPPREHAPDIDSALYTLRTTASASYQTDTRGEGDKHAKKAERKRARAIRKPLGTLLGVSLHRGSHWSRKGKTAIDLTDRELLVQVEVKNSGRATNADAAVEALRNFGKSASEGGDARGYPGSVALVVVAAGPSLEFFVCKFLDRPHMWRIATAPVARSDDPDEAEKLLDLFAALRGFVDALRKQRAAEKGLSEAQRCFPTLTNLDDEYHWFYAARLRANVFRVTKLDDSRTPMLLKLGSRAAGTQAREAHTWAASKGYAPAILHPEDSVLLTEWARGFKVADKLTNGEFTKLSRIVYEMHDAGFVHGDMRLPNVLVNGAGDVLLIDFDWSGHVGEVVYPPRMNKDVRWPPRAKTGETITKEDDLFMLEQLRPTHDSDSSDDDWDDE